MGHFYTRKMKYRLKLSDKELARIRREELGFVFQEFYLMDSLDVFENIMLPFYISKTVDDSKKERARVLIDKFGIRTLEKKMPAELSGGESAESCNLQSINK